jgi:hypothetical protein
LRLVIILDVESMEEWRYKLDSHLPGDLRPIAEWIYRAEEMFARGNNHSESTLTPEENHQHFKQLFDEHQVRLLIVCIY